MLILHQLDQSIHEENKQRVHLENKEKEIRRLEIEVDLLIKEIEELKKHDTKHKEVLK
jgi:hypothetical protein